MTIRPPSFDVPPLRPNRVLMTTDAVGGVWRYGVDLAVSLSAAGIDILLVCLGPTPSSEQQAEVEALPRTRLVFLDEPLDWMANSPEDLDGILARLIELAEQHEVDLLHLNLPTQAVGLETHLPVVTVSHSCVVTWWQTMRLSPLPEEWRWQAERNRRGFDAADAVVSPSASHAAALSRAYDGLNDIHVVSNAVAPARGKVDMDKLPFVLAAARWWDEGKNAVCLDAVAGKISWPLRAAGSLRGPGDQTFVFTHAEALGMRSASDVQTLMNEAAIFVSPSLYEPFGLAALEAASAGAALALADIPTYREIWDGAALFADPHDPEAFASAVELLIERPDARRDWAHRARARARTFSPERQSAAMLGVYAAAIAAKIKAAALPLNGQD